MRQLRKCTSSQLNTGVSKCPVDFGKMKGAILVEPGTKLPAKLIATELEKLAHANRPERIYGILTFVEYAKNGGEMQTAANGYGPEERTGLSARKDTFTMNKFYPELYSSLTKCSKGWDVYFFNEDNMLFGVNDGTDILAGFSMADVYADATEFATSSAKPTMTVTFCHSNPKDSAENFDFIQLDFDPRKLTLGLTAVKLEKADDANKYKLFEAIGGNDITSSYGAVLANVGSAVLNGATSAVSYDEESDTLTISATSGGTISLKSPSVLYDNDIKGIEQV